MFCKRMQPIRKLLYEGYLVLVVGTSDKDRNIHPLGIAVTSGEDKSYPEENLQN